MNLYTITDGIPEDEPLIIITDYEHFKQVMHLMQKFYKLVNTYQII